MSKRTSYQSGCRCEECGVGRPHRAWPERTDTERHRIETRILKALVKDPPVYRPAARRLKTYDARGGQVVVTRPEPVLQPWDIRPAKRAA